MTQTTQNTAAPDTTLATFTDGEDLTRVREPLGNASESSGIVTGTSHYCADTNDTTSIILSLESWLTLSKLSYNGYLLHISGTYTNTVSVEDVGRTLKTQGVAHVHIHYITQHIATPTHALQAHSVVRGGYTNTDKRQSPRYTLRFEQGHTTPGRTSRCQHK